MFRVFCCMILISIINFALLIFFSMFVMKKKMRAIAPNLVREKESEISDLKKNISAYIQFFFLGCIFSKDFG